MNKKIKAAVFTDRQKIEIKYIDKPLPKENEVLVKIHYCSICTWEQRAYLGVNKITFPFIGGHEVSGEVERIGVAVNGDYWKKGDKVVVGLMTACGECDNCKIGEEGNCEAFDYENQVGGLSIRGMGGFAQYLAVPVSKLFKLDESVSFLKATFTEPISCVIHSVTIADIKLGDCVVVVGAGVMGLLHIALAKIKGAYVIAIDRHDDRCAMAIDYGCDEVFNNSRDDEFDFIMKKTKGKGADIIFDTVSVSETAESVINYSALYGKVILYSSFHPDKAISLSPNKIHRRMTTVTGSANSNSRDYITATKLLDRNLISVDPLISKIVPIDDADYAFQRSIDKDTYRVVLKVSDEEMING